jgi:pyridoxine/pyridoxamine 5'-phosphate oxidase
MTQAADVPFEDAQAALAHCWQMLVRASRDRKAEWRTPVLATVGLDGAPRARVLVLRKVEPGAGLLWLHTDVRASKIAELRAEPRAALTFWDSRRALQLRVEGLARIESDPAVLAEAWARVPEGSRRNYATVAAPGSRLTDDAAYLADGAANFAVIAMRVERLEWLWLGPVVHQRGESRRGTDGWESIRLVP